MLLVIRSMRRSIQEEGEAGWDRVEEEEGSREEVVRSEGELSGLLVEAKELY
jgi:hypothetical protein